MKIEYIRIENIPAILWGERAEKLFLAIHGDQSHKADEVITIFAEVAVDKGYQVLSFDLPEHGGRKEEPRLCTAKNCAEDLEKIMKYAQALSNHMNLFGCSLGAYFGMLAYQNEPIEQALFLSPVVDMKRLIENMMMWFDVDKERLEREKKVQTPIQTLSWDYYQYVLQHPIKWEKPTAILYGRMDTLVELDCISSFSNHAGAELTILEDGEHFFHTKEQLEFFERWLETEISV